MPNTTTDPHQDCQRHTFIRNLIERRVKVQDSVKNPASWRVVAHPEVGRFFPISGLAVSDRNPGRVAGRLLFWPFSGTTVPDCRGCFAVCRTVPCAISSDKPQTRNP